MKKYNLNNWDHSLTNKGLLFFAEIIEEMLFHHSHDSFKVPTLNFKYLCYDILDTIKNIENYALDPGNLSPLIEELIVTYREDPIIQEIYGSELKELFKQKDESGKYKNTFNDICRERTSENTRNKLKKVLIYLIEDLDNCDKYYSTLINKLRFLVKKELTDRLENQIHRLSQIFLSELVNRDYSIENMYNIVLESFFSNTFIDDIDATFIGFINKFDFNEKNYAVYFPVSTNAKEELTECFNITFADNVFEMFNNEFPYVGKFKVKAMDPEQARMQAVEIIDLFFSLIQFDKHNSKKFKIRSADIVDVETNRCFFLSEPISAIIRGKRDEEILISKNFRPCMIKNLLSAISLHSTAINSTDISNQFLNLWTAVEVLIPIERKGSFSRINQIANALTTTLAITYFRSLLSHLKRTLSIIRYDYDACVKDIPGNDICQLACLLTKDEYSQQRTLLLNKLSSYPVIKYRINKYGQLLNNPKQMEKLYNHHSERIHQQIMRIYRTRNMIVHDGTKSLYIELILQNLHFYFDTLVDTIFTLQNLGYENISSVFKVMTETENQIIKIFEKDTFSTEDIKFICNVGALYEE